MAALEPLDLTKKTGGKDRKSLEREKQKGYDRPANKVRWSS